MQLQLLLSARLSRPGGGLSSAVTHCELAWILASISTIAKRMTCASACACVGEAVCGLGSNVNISERRADWLVSWLSKAACEKRVCVADLRAVLGRLSFALTALGHLRPFLGPVYAWIAVAEVRRLCQLPKALIFIFGFLATALKTGGCLVPVGRLPAVERELFGTDARAEGNEIWIGGWALDHRDKKKCRWFAERLSHTNAPWLYAAGEAAYVPSCAFSIFPPSTTLLYWARPVGLL